MSKKNRSSAPKLIVAIGKAIALVLGGLAALITALRM